MGLLRPSQLRPRLILWDVPMQNLAPVASQGGPFRAPAPVSRMARESSNLADESKPAVGVANI